MKQAVGRYVVSFQAERSYKGRRYHWMICSAQNPDELVSWGHAPTRSEEHTSELQSLTNLVCRLLLEKKRRTSHSIPPPRKRASCARSWPTCASRSPCAGVVKATSARSRPFFFLRPPAPPEITPLPPPACLPP